MNTHELALELNAWRDTLALNSRAAGGVVGAPYPLRYGTQQYECWYQPYCALVDVDTPAGARVTTHHARFGWARVIELDAQREQDRTEDWLEVEL